MATFILILFTVAASLWHWLGGAEKELVISPQNVSFKIVDDTSQGGTTQSELYFNDQSSTLTCQIKNTAQWPFCEIAIVLSETNEGIDLQKYHSIGINVDYDSPIENERIRVYLRNYDPSYSKISDPVSLKFNAIEYAPGQQSGLSVIPLKAFQVLSWWIAEYEVPIEKSGAQFNNITFIEIATGSNVREATYTIKLNKLVFYGEWISESHLMRFLVVLWVSVAIVFLCIEQWQLRRHLVATEERASMLHHANRNLYEKSQIFEDLAYNDMLTGVRNRNGINEWLVQIIEYSTRNDQPFSMIYLDIDHFKVINDSFGHQKGDETLKLFAELISKRIRKSDVFVRWGGEEFIIFCPTTTLAGAVELSQLIRSIVESYQWAEGRVITCSAGVAELGDENIESLIARADAALYRAKQRGRNRVEVA
ncbi:GGDEF domain-containing protein [Photobacterium sp.]|uniref:GGDEF domain-containing protein n=1 Tax=Photobacterium sp. TaxID=660 RepID=UPI00299D7B37|nr:GGDEF domain-containing protein [Photobacterium sp.]MDX1301711.1 GGDEF domain-containing protein [Photobacterium sp.]